MPEDARGSRAEPAPHLAVVSPDMPEDSSTAASAPAGEEPRVGEAHARPPCEWSRSLAKGQRWADADSDIDSDAALDSLGEYEFDTREKIIGKIASNSVVDVTKEEYQDQGYIIPSAITTTRETAIFISECSMHTMHQILSESPMQHLHQKHNSKLQDHLRLPLLSTPESATHTHTHTVYMYMHSCVTPRLISDLCLKVTSVFLSVEKTKAYTHTFV